MGERDRGGFTANFARAFFKPESDGKFAIAVGTGSQDRTGTGHYTISVRIDDHADDYQADPTVTLKPGDSITAKIDSDVSPDHPGLNSWHWGPILGSDDEQYRPRRGIESLDDRDLIRFEISLGGEYELALRDAPLGVGFWFTWDANGNLVACAPNAPASSIRDYYPAGIYYAEVGTPYESNRNVGEYTVALQPVQMPDDQNN